jgi:hypothetical protein
MYENRDSPLWPVHEQTLAFDAERHRQVAWLNGRVILPLGSEIDLFDAETNSQGTATVTGVRLVNGTETVPHQVCLDCDVDDGWWSAFDSRDE